MGGRLGKMIVKFNEDVLTIYESVMEGDAFLYSVNYDRWVEIILCYTKKKLHKGSIYAKRPNTTQSTTNINHEG